MCRGISTKDNSDAPAAGFLVAKLCNVIVKIMRGKGLGSPGTCARWRLFADDGFEPQLPSDGKIR